MKLHPYNAADPLEPAPLLLCVSPRRRSVLRQIVVSVPGCYPAFGSASLISATKQVPQRAYRLPCYRCQLLVRFDRIPVIIRRARVMDVPEAIPRSSRSPRYCNDHLGAVGDYELAGSLSAWTSCCSMLFLGTSGICAGGFARWLFDIVVAGAPLPSATNSAPWRTPYRG